MKRAFYPTLVPLFAFLMVLSTGAVNGYAQRPHLELQELKQSATQSAITLNGQVKNISTADVSGVSVFCDFQGAGGRILRTEETHLDKDPLKVNAVATFSCNTQMSGDIKGYNVRFVRLFGGPLVVKPAAPKK